MITASVHAPSWYAATANPHPDRPALEGDLDVDLLVVGGGFTGLSTAIEAAGRGPKVALVEAERVGWGASGRNGGQAVTGFNKDVSTIARLVGKDDARRLWEMAEEAKAVLRQRVAEFAIDCDLRWGYLFAALKARHMRDLQSHLAELEALGYGDARLVTKDEVASIVDAPRYVGGMLDRGGGQLHPLNYALGLAAATSSPPWPSAPPRPRGAIRRPGRSSGAWRREPTSSVPMRRAGSPCPPPTASTRGSRS